MKENKKKFILGMTGWAFFTWIFRAVLAGAIQAAAAFFVRKHLDKSKKGEET